jgi:hypothetical protein
MAIGDSVFVPCDKHGRPNVRATAGVVRKRKSIAFITRTVTEAGIDGIRIWRVGPRERE